MSLMGNTQQLTVAELARHYPVLVYGSLRVGGYNHEALLEGIAVYSRTLRLPGFRMYANGSAFPYAVEALPEDGRSIVVDVLDIPADQWAEVSARLDALEGFTPGGPLPLQHYVRTWVQMPDTREPAWLYLASPRVEWRTVWNDRPLPEVESGDWADVDPSISTRLPAEAGA